MKKLILLAAVLLILCQIGAWTTETGSFKAFMYQNVPGAPYNNWMSHIAEGIASANYNNYAPYDRQLNGFGNFKVATTSELNTWGGIVDLFLAGEYDAAQTAINSTSIPYTVVQYNDTDTGRSYYMLRENISDLYLDDNGTADPYDDEIGSFAYSWGLYVHNPAGNRPIVVTVPHPTDDFPTVALGVNAFNTWNAQYLLVSGAGREVRWTNIPPYTNSKSLSDPTRVASHPFNTCYKKFADKIRTDFNMREFSAQIHSYDWNIHHGYANAQISVGNPKYCPNLPVRDLSNLRHDLIHQGNHVMIPANTYGIHSEVLLNDYYAVNYSTHDFIFHDGEHEYPVNNSIDLPAYTQNYQMLYTLSGWNDYDAYDPFFHVEMDELPNNYELTYNNFKWFYGWDEASQRWDYNHVNDRFLSYYMRWVNDLDNILDETFAMNDNVPPTNPSNLSVVNESLTSVTLSWDRSFAYDFDTYEVLYATEPIGADNFNIFSNTNAPYLASQAAEEITVTGLQNANTYYFKLRAKDKNGNYSAMSNQVTVVPAPANVSSFRTFGMNERVRLYWTVGGQTSNLGFSIYRKDATGDYVLKDSYLTNSGLMNSSASSFTWWDEDVVNDALYTYKISSRNASGAEYYYNYPSAASPRKFHTIYIRNTSGTAVDSISFAANPYASDGQDSYWDVSKSGPSSNGYVWNAFWEQYWGNNGTSLSREVKSSFDLNNELKGWIMRVRSDLNTQLYIEASDTFERAEKLYLQDGAVWFNLLSGPYAFTVPNSNIRTMNLLWGNLAPAVTIGSQANQIYQGGGTMAFYWNYTHPFLIDHANLWIMNGNESVMISENVSTSSTSFTYYIPQSMDWQNCKFVVDLVATDGLVKRYFSNYTFAIVPAMSFAYNEAGPKMRTNPWADSDLQLDTVFGAGSVAYEWNLEDQWLENSTFANARFVNSPEVSFYSTTSAVTSTETTFDLRAGWNFIPNPHLCTYEIEDIRFYLDNTLFRMGEMVAQGLISRGIYVYRDGSYTLADSLAPYEAMLIKYYGTSDSSPKINFYPYFSAPKIDPIVSNWQLGLRASASLNDRDEIKIGANKLSTNSYDFAYDLPKAPRSPFETVHMQISHADDTDNSYVDRLLQEDFRAAFTAGVDSVKTWNISIYCPNTSPLAMEFVPEGISDAWTVSLHMNGEEGGHHLYNGNTFELSPTQAGWWNGIITIRSYPVANDDLVQMPISGLKSYPNPFNPSTTISFNLGQAGLVKAEIFNLRGQKVFSLCNQQMTAGNHKLLWNGLDANNRRVGSGVYFVRIASGNKSQYLKMMLIK